MLINRQKVLKELKEVFLISLLGPVMMVIFCWECFGDFDVAWRVIVIGSSLWIALWKGNEYLSAAMSRWISWMKAPSKRFAVGLVVLVVYTTAVVLAMYISTQRLLNISISRDPLETVLLSVTIGLIISLFSQGREFLFSWRQLAINQEKLKTESLSSKYESLKNQVNPHFLFNSLNALTSLVHQDPDLAVRFIKQLADVYRYVLEQKDKELVDLKTELNFLSSYLFLQKIRFGENLIVDVRAGNSEDLMVPPLSIQMLVENAIKHNIISKDDPLSIEVFLDQDGYLVVKNNLQKKKVSQTAPRVGLSNIKARYEFLTSKTVDIELNSHSFLVRLPTLSLNSV